MERDRESLLPSSFSTMQAHITVIKQGVKPFQEKVQWVSVCDKVVAGDEKDAKIMCEVISDRCNAGRGQ